MDYSTWKIVKADFALHEAEYEQVAAWCRANGYRIVDDGTCYKVQQVPAEPEPTLERRVRSLERDYNMARWQREGILADGSPYSEYAKAKAQEIEDLAEELRHLNQGE